MKLLRSSTLDGVLAWSLTSKHLMKPSILGYRSIPTVQLFDRRAYQHRANDGESRLSAVPTQHERSNKRAGSFVPKTPWLQVLSFITEHILDFQAPNRIGGPGTPQPVKRGLYQVVFSWVARNRLWINELPWFKTRFFIYTSGGMSNWPTMTGHNEFTLNAIWYAGGRDCDEGDMILARNPAKKSGNVKGAWVNKRIIGFEGLATDRKLGFLGSSQVTVR